MLGFDQEFQNGTSKITKVWLNFTLSDGTSLEFHEDRVLFNGFVRDTSTTVDGQFTVGAAVTGKLTLNLDNTDDALSRYDFRGATVVAWLGGEKSDETIEKINAGRYYIDEYTYNGSNVTLIGYDDMSRFDVPCVDTSIVWTDAGKTIENLITDALSVTTGLSLWNAPGTLPIPSGYKVTQKPSQWDTMTCHDIIAYCAQIMNCFAHIVYVDTSPGYYALKFEWYDTAQLTSNQYDGGTFDTDTTPYSDGATLNGGSFNPWNTGDAVDGGAFGDRTGVHIIPSPYDLTVDTDDVMITGVTVTLSSSDNINATDDTKDYTTPLDPSGTNPPVKGEAGYVINISGNPFIETTTQAETVAAFIYSHIGGMRFRPLSASVVSDPSMEAGDVAIVVGRNENTYSCFLSRVTYTVNDATQISCDAVSGKQNLKARYSETQKTQAIIQQMLERSATNTENAMHSILSAYAASMGLYPYTESDGHGGTIYTYGNASTLAASNIRWRFSAGALSVSTDYGRTWNAALSADGVAVLNRLYAEGINADYITTGSLNVSKNGNTILDANVDAGNVLIGGFNVDYQSFRYNKSSIVDANEGVYLGPSGLAVGDFRVYPSMQAVSGKSIGRVIFGNVEVEYSWSSSSSKFINMHTGSLDVIASDSIYFRVGDDDNNCHILSMLTDQSIWITSKKDVWITANNGYGTVYIVGDLQNMTPV